MRETVMPIPPATTTLHYDAFDEVDELVRRPRECLIELKKRIAIEKHRGVVFTNTPDETYLMMLAYGCTSDGPFPVDEFAALIESVGADPIPWERPTDRFTAVGRLVLPLANFLNLALGLENHHAWDRGLGIMRSANAKLARWFENKAATSPAIEHDHDRERDEARDGGAAVLEEWGNSASRSGRDNEAGRARESHRRSGYARQVSDYEAQLDEHADRSKDALIAGLAADRLRQFKRGLALRHDAVTLGPGGENDYNDGLRDATNAQRENERAVLAFVFTTAACAAFGWNPTVARVCFAMDLMDYLGLEGSTPPHQRPNTQGNSGSGGAANSPSTPQTQDTTPSKTEFMTAVQDSRSAREQREQGERDQERWDRMHTGRVAPHAHYDNDTGSLADFLKEATIRLDWNSRRAAAENGRMTVAEVMDAAFNRALRLINVRPDQDEIRGDPQQVLAEAIARINRLVNPGRGGGSTAE